MSPVQPLHGSELFVLFGFTYVSCLASLSWVPLHGSELIFLLVFVGLPKSAQKLFLSYF